MAGTANINVPGAPNYPLPGVSNLGAIQGGALRPGAIDQSRFQQLLLAQSQAQGSSPADPSFRQTAAPAPQGGLTLDDYRKLAGQPRSAALPPPPAAETPPPATLIDGIPNLTAEQFAVLTGLKRPDAPASDPSAPAATSPAATDPMGAPTDLSAPTSSAPAEPAARSQIAALNALLDAPDAVPDLGPDLGPDMAPDLAPATASQESELPDDAATAKAAESDDRVVWVDSMPDRDDRRRIAASGRQVRIRETPGANELFLGPDGKFGWDDALDIINPLQHIPIVAQIYRAVSGDQAYGLSQFAGAIPFGPISIASAVIDTVVRSETGRDAGTDIAAAILGVDNRTPEEANLHLVTEPAADMAAAPAESADLQEAVIDPGPAWMRENRVG
jgi:hypothetical protein